MVGGRPLLQLNPDNGLQFFYVENILGFRSQSKSHSNFFSNSPKNVKNPGWINQHLMKSYKNGFAQNNQWYHMVRPIVHRAPATWMSPGQGTKRMKRWAKPISPSKSSWGWDQIRIRQIPGIPSKTGKSWRIMFDKYLQNKWWWSEQLMSFNDLKY